ncbi:MAG: site-2 protease family protein [Candidatus Nanohaloarchaeota archaeon QJJ-7]|nr:site-2 protease family protein [Candidatus Nanohaloarchaeota archaeon QJJ-7]
MDLPVSLNVLSIVLFIAALAVTVWRDRENIERYSIVLVRRTKRGIELLDKTASLSPRFWRIWSTLGVVVGLLGMVGTFLLIFEQTLKLFFVGGATPPVGPVLPTVSTVTNPQESGYLGLPFWHFMISLSVVLVVHEMMHGVIARVEGFDVEYVGMILIGILPGAFVQPEGQRDFFEPAEDEEKGGPWEQGSALSRLRVLSAGPFANVTVAALLLLVLFGAFTTAHGSPELRGFYDHEGMSVMNVSQDSPAESAGLEPGMMITSIGNQSTESLKGFQEAASGLEPGETLEVKTGGNGSFSVTLAERERPEGNITYDPAPIDYLLAPLENNFPGTVQVYENYNDILVPDDPEVQIGRWNWMGKNYDGLKQRAEEKVSGLEKEREIPEKGYMGVIVAPSTTAKESLEPFVGPLFTFFQILFFVALLNLMIGIANLLPVKGLDGGWMLDTALQEKIPRYADGIVRNVTILTIAMIAISFVFLIGEHLI